MSHTHSGCSNSPTKKCGKGFQWTISFSDAIASRFFCSLGDVVVIVVVEIEVVVIEVAVIDVVVCVVSVPDVVVDVPLADRWRMMADAWLMQSWQPRRVAVAVVVVVHSSLPILQRTKVAKMDKVWQSMTKSKCSCSKVRQPLESFGNLQCNKGGQFPLPKTFQTHFTLQGEVCNVYIVYLQILDILHGSCFREQAE